MIAAALVVKIIHAVVVVAAAVVKMVVEANIRIMLIVLVTVM